MHICLVGPATSIHTQRWAESFSARGHDIAVVHTGCELTDSGCQQRQYRVVEPFADTGYKGSLATAVGYRYLHKYLNQKKFDVINIHYLRHGALVPWIYRIEVPVIASLWGRDVVPDDTESTWDFWSKKIALQHTDAVCVLSGYLRDQVTRYCGRENTRLIRWGVDTEKFRRRERLQESGPPTIGFFKHLLPKYGPHLMIDCLKQLASAGTEANLLMVGGGQLGDDLKKRARSLGIASRVTFTGPVSHDQVPRLMNRCAVIGMPSQYPSETLGVAALEAQACAVPVVASRIGGVGEAVKDEVTGFLVDPRQSEAFAETVRYLLENDGKRREMAARARRFVVRSYSWDDRVTEMINLFEEYRLQ